ncbi:CYFIP-related Rac1 interactor B [Pimephales promelas]|nr:CYFIP-related Rac1 interactor B [Pimephales promelas]
MTGIFWILHLARAMMTQCMEKILSGQSAVGIVFTSHFSSGSSRFSSLRTSPYPKAVTGLPAMGNLIKVLGKDLENCPHFFLDFENAQPTEAETAVYNQVSAVLEEAHGILAELQSYNGAGQEIREAIQNPNDLQLQEKAWNAVCPLVAKLKRFYEFSLRLENALRSLLEALTSPPYAPMQHLEREQALAKQFAEILHFTLSFDELKMTNPAIQNDFSYYRRTISRNRLNNQQLEAENEVNNEMANRMSLFYAEATPMLKTLSNATTKFVSENKTLPIEDTTDCLSTMACVCRVMLETPEYRCRFTNTDTMLFCMRVMVGVIILYDHVHPVGAFAKTSKIDMKGCIKVLKEQPSNSVEGLLNALRAYLHTRHLAGKPPLSALSLCQSPSLMAGSDGGKASALNCSRPAQATPMPVSRGNRWLTAWRTQATSENIQP